MPWACEVDPFGVNAGASVPHFAELRAVAVPPLPVAGEDRNERGESEVRASAVPNRIDPAADMTGLVQNPGEPVHSRKYIKGPSRVAPFAISRMTS